MNPHPTPPVTPGLSGYVCTRNCIELDYPFVEAILSLLPVCDEVVVCDNESIDGTFEMLRQLAANIPALRVIEWREVLPVADRTWYDRWLNFARSYLRYQMQLAIDADEIIDPGSYSAIRQAAREGKVLWFEYVNFWSDPQHTVPWGDSRKAQLAPTKYWMPSHAPVPAGETDIRTLAEYSFSNVTLYHYNSLRREEAFIKKQRLTMNTLEGCDDVPLERAIAEHRRYVSEVDPRTVSRFEGEHPPVIRQWLVDRGWTL